MIRWILERLERDPYAVFYERELRELFPKEFEDESRSGLLRRVPLGKSMSLGFSRPRILVESDDGSYDAYDDENPDEDPVRVTGEDILRWSLDLHALAERFQAVNALDGRGAGPLDDHLYLLGESAYDGRDAVIFGLLRCGDALDRLRSLPSRLPSYYDRAVVVCPTFAPPPASQRELETLSIAVVPLGRTDPLRLELEMTASATKADCRCGLEHGKDFRWIRASNEEFSLTRRQAKVVSLLHEAFLAGRPDRTWGQIATELPTTPENMAQVFKGEPRWGLLVTRSRRDLYRLNVRLP